MDIVSLLVGLIIIALVFWAVRALLGAFSIGDPIATVVYVLLVVIVIIYLLGMVTGSPVLHFGNGARLR
jgi:uncharacterized membrane protein YwzB